MNLYKGVRRMTVVEIKNLFGPNRHLYMTVKMSVQEAAVAHDLARVLENPDVDEKLLNIGKLASDIQLEDADMVRIDPPLSKDFYTEFLKNNPLEGVEIKEQIVRQAPSAFSSLKSEIRYHSSRGGRQRMEVDDGWMLPRLPEANPQEISNEENMQPNVTEYDGAGAEIAALKRACEEKDAVITAKDAAIRDLQEEIYAADEQAKIVTPFKYGYAMREKCLYNDANSAAGVRIERSEMPVASDCSFGMAENWNSYHPTD